MKNSIYKSAAQVTFFSAVEKSLSFIYRIVLSRTIGAEGVGIYHICLSVFSVFLTASSSGIPITVSRLMAKNQALGNPYGKHSALSAGVVCTLFITLPVCIIAFLGRNYFAKFFPDSSCMDIFLLLMPGLVLTSIYSVIRGAFWGNKQFLPYSLIELAEDGVMVIVGCILINFATTATQGAYFATVAVLVSYIFSFVTSVGWYLLKGGRFVNPKSQLKPLISSSLPITAMRTSTALLNSLVAMFLPSLLMADCGMTNAEALALYGTVMGMSIPILFIPNALIGSIAVVVAPEMSQNFYSRNMRKLQSDVQRIVKTAILIATLLIPLLFSLGKQIGQVLYSNELSGQIICRYSFVLLPMCIGMISTTLLNSMNLERKTLLYYFIGGAVMLVCIFALTPTLAMDAYMIGFSLSFIITAILNLRLLAKECGRLSFFKCVISVIIICAICCLFGYFTVNLLGRFLPPIATLFVCAPIILAFECAALALSGQFKFIKINYLLRPKKLSKLFYGKGN